MCPCGCGELDAATMTCSLVEPWFEDDLGEDTLETHVFSAVEPGLGFKSYGKTMKIKMIAGWSSFSGVVIPHIFYCWTYPYCNHTGRFSPCTSCAIPPFIGPGWSCWGKDHLLQEASNVCLGKTRREVDHSALHNSHVDKLVWFRLGTWFITQPFLLAFIVSDMSIFWSINKNQSQRNINSIQPPQLIYDPKLFHEDVATPRLQQLEGLWAFRSLAQGAASRSMASRWAAVRHHVERGFNTDIFFRLFLWLGLCWNSMFNKELCGWKKPVWKMLNIFVEKKSVVKWFTKKANGWPSSLMCWCSGRSGSGQRGACGAERPGDCCFFSYFFCFWKERGVNSQKIGWTSLYHVVFIFFCNKYLIYKCKISQVLLRYFWFILQSFGLPSS